MEQSSSRRNLSDEKLPDHVIIKNDSSSDSSGTNTTLGSTASRLRSRNSFARRRKESDARTQSPPRSSLRRNVTPNNEDGDTPKRKPRTVSEKEKRRIVIGGSSFIPDRLRLLLIQLTPAYTLFMKLRARYKLCFAILTFCVYVCCRKSIRRARINYFGLHPIHGGSLGVKWDRANIQRVMKESHEKRSQELEELGVILPDTQPPASLLDIDTHAALREHLVRRENRSKHLIQAEAVADVYQRGCVDRKAPGEGTLHAFFHRSDGSFHDQGIPKHIFVPDVVSWQRPRPGKPASFVHLTFDETEMRLLIADNYLPLLNTFDSLKRLDDRIHLWSICALYFYGGVFLGSNTAVHADVVRDIVESSANGLFDGIHNHCSSPTGLAVFNKSENSNGKSSIDVLMIAATPRHPHLRCVMNHLESASDSVQASQVLESFFLDDTWESTHTFHHLTKTRHEAPWEMLTTQCGYGHAHTQECCHGMNFHEIQELPVDGISPTQGSLYVQLLELEAPDESEVNVVKVHVKEKEGTEAPVKSEKIFLEDVMSKQGIEPNWLCTRCLKTSLYGTLETCSKVCSSGYENLMCYAPDDPEKARVDVEVTVNTTKATAKRIPRIIHQTWFEELSADRYPELVRLQNSWKRSGWEYRFYNDETARNFIVDNFPSRFADAFDALIPGAYKADLFRYLVLMKEGGVYADVDILLDASLDDFVTPSLSFFAPRDVVCEYAGEPFCLWNGLIGSAPGHPFIIRAVERLVNLILERADLYDMERAVCRRVGRKMENWKVRAEPLLLASGPCALGVAVNDAIGRESLAKLDIGWIPSDAIKDESEQDHGDALILVGDKFDLGSFRISDPERSYILASTDLPDVTKESRELSNPTRGELRRRQQRHGPLPHYSEAAKGEFVWGVHNVYHDNLVNNEELKFRVVYS